MATSSISQGSDGDNPLVVMSSKKMPEKCTPRTQLAYMVRMQALTLSVNKNGCHATDWTQLLSQVS